jgi:serine O-acetyltransferase
MFDRLSTIRTHIVEDVRTALAKDPAAKSALEVALCYPGVHAVWLYRIAHHLWTGDHRLAARLLSEFASFLTGVEIHPAATIGDRLFVDHGTGVVIGETAEIGDDVLVYHGVTLGGKSMRREKRHPTLEDCVTVGANATLLGDITVEEGATVGAGAVVSEGVPAGATVAGNPAEVVETPPSNASTAETEPEAGADPEKPHWLTDC